MPMPDAIIDTLARTLYAEAGTRPVRAIEALACLAVNRARAALPRPPRVSGAPPFARGGHARLPEPGPAEVNAACRDPFLFPAWNPRHPAHARLSPPPADPALAICRRIAGRALSGALRDATCGATHWHPAEVLPAWAVARETCAEVADLVFYRLETGLPPVAPTAPVLVTAA